MAPEPASIRELRAAVVECARQLADRSHPLPAERLSLATLREAATAHPGALVDLARWALSDLTGNAPGVERLQHALSDM
jgi:hypothetical protein